LNKKKNYSRTDCGKIRKFFARKVRDMSKRVIIIGAGPTGLGASYRLRELGYTNWKIYEKNTYLGGHASSHLDNNGFVWDEGGHVIFSHYKYFDEFIGKLLGKDYLEHMRESWIRMMGVWIPYPFQNNIRYLPKEAQLKCIIGLIEAQNKGVRKALNFEEWIIETFGEGIMVLKLMITSTNAVLASEKERPKDRMIM